MTKHSIDIYSINPIRKELNRAVWNPSKADPKKVEPLWNFQSDSSCHIISTIHCVIREKGETKKREQHCEEERKSDEEIISHILYLIKEKIERNCQAWNRL